MSPEAEAAKARIIEVFGKPDPRPHPLVSMLQNIADSGRGLIIHEHEVICEPLVPTAVTHLGNNTHRVMPIERAA